MMFEMSNINYIDPITNWLGLEDLIGDISIWSILVRFILTFICAGLIGLERARRRHAAGFRTYILVSLGAMIAIFTNQYIFEVYGQGDIGRLGAQVISGIGFLGAGTILVTSRSQIKGLTTAAGLWVSACIGLSIGIGFYTVGIIGTIFALVAFVFLPRLEKIFTKNSNTLEIHVELFSRSDLKKLIDYIRTRGGKINLVDYNSSYANSGLSVYTINMVSWNKNANIVIQDILDIEYVNFSEILL